MPAKTHSELPSKSTIDCLKTLGGYRITIQRDEIDRALGQITLQATNDLWRVLEVAADDGWGPMLYDIAMELATVNDAQLACNELKITPDAEAIWQFYLDERQDVVTSPLPENERSALGRPLRFGWQKQPVLISKLQANGQWSEREESLQR